MRPSSTSSDRVVQWRSASAAGRAVPPAQTRGPVPLSPGPAWERYCPTVCERKPHESKKMRGDVEFRTWSKRGIRGRPALDRLDRDVRYIRRDVTSRAPARVTDLE